MSLRRTYKYRIYPTRRQIAALEEHLRFACDLYNAALEQRIWAWSQGSRVSFFDQAKDLTDLRRDDRAFPEGMNTTAQRDPLLRLDRAFQAFFRRVQAGQRPGHPRFRSVARYDSLTWTDGHGFGDGRLRLQGIGHVKVKWHRALPGEATIQTVAVRRRAGRWYACFSLKSPVPKPLERTGQDVGIDLGISAFAATSTGEMVEGPRAFRKGQAELRRAQRKVARRERGSKRQRKARTLVARKHDRVQEIRRDHAHKTALDLVRRYDRICIEDLNIAGLSRGMLAKDVSDQGWANFVGVLRDKAEWAGRQVIAVDPRGTSQMCSECGTVVPKGLAVRVHVCGCGYVADRDVNAARNVMRAGLALQARTVGAEVHAVA